MVESLNIFVRFLTKIFNVKIFLHEIELMVHFSRFLLEFYVVKSYSCVLDLCQNAYK